MEVQPVVSRRLLLAAPFGVLAELALAQSFPSRPIRIIVPSAPGGSLDWTCHGFVPLL